MHWTPQQYIISVGRYTIKSCRQKTSVAVKPKPNLTLEEALTLKVGVQVVYHPRGAGDQLPKNPDLENGLSYKISGINLYRGSVRLTEDGKRIAEGQPDSVLLRLEGCSIKSSYRLFYR